MAQEKQSPPVLPTPAGDPDNSVPRQGNQDPDAAGGPLTPQENERNVKSS